MENYEVIGLNEANLPHYIAAIETLEEATKIQQSAKAVGWPRAAVFYASARRYTREDLRWIMAVYSGTDPYGPSRRVFMYEVRGIGARFWNSGNHNGEKWRIAFRREDGSLGQWSKQHYDSLGSALGALKAGQ